MKLAAFVSAVLALSSAAAQTPPVVVFVHGRMSVESDTAMLRREWRQALNASLGDRGYRQVADADVRLGWYADVLDPMAEGCPRASNEDDGLDAFGILLSAIVGTIPRGEARDAKAFVNDVMFVLDESRRCAARQRVGREIERALATGKPVVVVAYSLGSIVAYQYLKERAVNPADPPIDLVTIGSPLGVPELRALLGLETETLRKPRSVRSWNNIHDPEDPIAGPIATDTVSRGVSDIVTKRSREGQSHMVERYLRDPATAEIMGKLLNPGTTVRP
jgi:hypothetical protein